ncbi:PREDICTED: 1-acyl-sn-glycerol-3-phosphate acyltransferase alpha isoform X2 [Chrysochloris asiatica]|uniref:1-acyl-sn-glycerol-3-phosphate acyltransferase n=1 Tax=Chrysochloris asiatica TaxID=185453 RepID=A0A9B0U4H6_CHRAS|nr:PREDICTED: 1-acyl-sn-glycerol-3-phosphate acyltransferase alpha isoform X2 [Chrysochloris asiatica]
MDGTTAALPAAALPAAHCVVLQPQCQVLLQDGLLQWLDPLPGCAGHPCVCCARTQRGEYEPYVVVSNHQSSLDLLGMMEVLPGRCVPIAKRELLWAGSAGLACWLAGVIFIDRKRTGDAISVMSEVAQTLLTQDVRVWVFPEGTRNHNGSMLPFKRGAFHLAVQAQVPIVPIVMSSYQDFYCKKERRFTSGRCQVRVLPPVPTEGLTPDDVPELADRVRHSMLTVFREISTDGQGGGDYLKKPVGVAEARL